MLFPLIFMILGWGGTTFAKQIICPKACPVGWNSWGPIGPTSKHCYLMPSQPVKRGNYTVMRQYCKDSEPTSYPIVLNDPIEQAAGSVIVLQYIANYLADVTDIFVWLGAYKKDGKWIYEDDSDGTYNLNAIEAILKSAPDGSCLCAEPKTLGVWFTRECSASSGAAICEMEPIPVCGAATGGFLPISTAAVGGKGAGEVGPGGIKTGIPGIGR